MNDINHRITLDILETDDDAVEAIASTVVGVVIGEMTSTEANSLARLVVGFVKAIEASDLSKRIAALEKQL